MKGVITVISQKAKEKVSLSKYRKINSFETAIEILYTDYECSNELRVEYFLHCLNLTNKKNIDTLFSYFYLKSTIDSSELSDCAFPYFQKKLSYCSTFEEIDIANQQLNTYDKYDQNIVDIFREKYSILLKDLHS